MKKLLYIIPLLILCSGVASAGNFTITANNSVTLASILSFTASLNNNYFLPYSLQETANVSTVFGGKASGTYNFVGVAGANGWAYINYSKNDTFFPLPIWQVRHGINTSSTSLINSVKNYTIPLSCWSFSTTNIQLRMYTSMGLTSGRSWGECNNGTQWVLVTENITCTGASVFTPVRNTGNDYFYDTNYSRGIFYELNGVNLFKNVNDTGISGPTTCDGTGGNSGVAGIIFEEGLWWYDGYNSTYTTATGSIVTNITNNVARKYDITLSSTGYVTETTSGWNVSTNLSALLDPYQLNLTFFDENTTLLMNGTLVSFSITGTNYSYNNTTLTGSAIIPTIANNITLNIIYSAPGYNQRNYYTNISTANTTIALFLRSTATSSVLQVHVIDQTPNAVQNALVYQTVKNLSGTNYYTTEICQTDVNGNCLMTADIASTTYLPTTVYNFLVYYNGTLAGSSGDTQLFSNTLQIQINTARNPLLNYFSINGIQYTNITYDSTTNTFGFTAFDPSNTISNICLRTYMRTGSTLTQTNGTCTAGFIATINVFSNTSLGDETIAVASIYLNNQQYQLDRYSVLNETGGVNYRTYFLIFVFVGVLLTMFLGVRYLATTAIIMLAGMAFVLVRISGSILPIIAVTGFIGMAFIIWMRMKGE